MRPAAGTYSAGAFVPNLYCSFHDVVWPSFDINGTLGPEGAIFVSSSPPVFTATGPYGAVNLSMPWSGIVSMNNYIYRSATLGGTLTFLNSTTATEYTDTGLTPGGTYYYVIDSYGPNGTKFVTPTNEAVAGVAAFVAIAQSQTNAAYSADGIHWTNSIGGMPTTAAWTSVAYGEGMFVAVAGSGNHAAYSYDGIHWNESTLSDFSASWNSVTYGDGMFVAVGAGQGVAHSTDGVNWTVSSAAMPASQTWTSVTYGDGEFVAVCSEGGSVDDCAYSANGTSWTANAMTADGKWNCIGYGGSTFVAITGPDLVNYGSFSSGISFSSSSVASTGWSGIAYGDSRFVAVAGVSSGSTAAYSSTGATWTSSTLPSSHSWTGVACGSGTFAAVAHGTSDAAYSTTGTTWTASTMSSSANWISVAAEQ